MKIPGIRKLPFSVSRSLIEIMPFLNHSLSGFVQKKSTINSMLFLGSLEL